MSGLHRLTGGAVVALTLAPASPAWAQAAPEAATMEQLREMVRARDAVIDDLLRRVEELERRTGAPPAPAPAPAATPEEPPAAVPAVRAEARPAEPSPPAPGQFEVDPEAVDRALERALVQTGALLLRPGTAEIEPSFGYVRREDDAPGLILEDGNLIATANEVRRNELQAGLTLRLGLPFDSQLEIGVPYRYEEVSSITREGFAERGEDGEDGAGFDDVSLGLAKGLLREEGWRPDLIGRVRWDSKTGEAEGGVALGSGFHEITGSLTAVKRQDPLVFVGTASYVAALEDDGVAPGDEVGLSLGTVLAASPETSLRFFVRQAFAGETEIDGREVDGSDEVSTSLFIGASSTLLPRVLLDVTAGIGLTEDAPDYSINVSLPIRFDLPFRFF